jgi:hypothetical protein
MQQLLKFLLQTPGIVYNLDIRKEPDPIKLHDFAKEYFKWSIENKEAVSEK